MPISQNTYTVPNNFVQQYDLGQKKIRADLVDENFTDAATAINTLLTDDANTVHLTGAETISGNKTFTGTNAFSANTTGVTATDGDNSTKFATTAFVQKAKPSASSSTPAARSTSGSVGTSAAYARADHSHPKNWGTSSSVTATAPAVIVETWHSGTEWYRVWSDGWIEQGGTLTWTASHTQVASVVLNKAMTTANYDIQITPTGNKPSSTGRSSCQFAEYYDVSTTAFGFCVGAHTASYVYGTGMKWYACGY